MSNIVTCGTQGQSLTKWARRADSQDKEALCEALDCMPELEGATTQTAETTYDEGTISAEVRVSEDEGNTLEVRSDGLYAEVRVSEDEGNTLEVRSDGLYVDVPQPETPPEMYHLVLAATTSDTFRPDFEDADRFMEMYQFQGPAKVRVSVWLADSEGNFVGSLPEGYTLRGAGQYVDYTFAPNPMPQEAPSGVVAFVEHDADGFDTQFAGLPGSMMVIELVGPDNKVMSFIAGTHFNVAGSENNIGYGMYQAIVWG